MTSLAAGLRAFLGDRAVLPGDDRYDEARRVWNAEVDRRPAAIAFCANAVEVATAVRAARDADVGLTVRAGGHSVSGASILDDTLVVDVSLLKRVSFDDGVVHAGAGLLAGDLDRATESHGLATTGGVISHTGIAGLTLGGGIGWLMRHFGAACDNLLTAQVVTAAGDVIEVDDDHELMWGLRGAGARLAAVTRLDLRVHPLERVVAGMLAFPANRCREVLSAYDAFTRNAPDELSTIVYLRRTGHQPWVPPEWRGEPVILVGVCWSGETRDADRALATIRALRPAFDTVRPTRYVDHQRLLDVAVPHGLHYRWRSGYVDSLDSAGIDALADRAWRMRSPWSFVVLFHLGGAMAGSDPGSALFAGRRGFAVNINGAWGKCDEPDTAWVLDTWGALEPLTNGSAYINFLDDDAGDRLLPALGGPAPYQRLTDLKRRWDPDGVFGIGLPAPSSSK
jgi:FAD/FMN-containing dehydrogenase